MAIKTYSGIWDENKAAHLLRRTLFGPTYKQIKEAESLGMIATLDSILTLPTQTYPLTVSSDEQIAKKGETWIDKPYPTDIQKIQLTNNKRNESLGCWAMENIAQGHFSIIEKMSLFWQNHFAAEDSNDARATYNYINLLRTNALGNFRELVKVVTIDPCMLMFLNGNSNTKNKPNENYSRELLELFSVGKGPQVGAGDYTNFTEEDIKQGAKILTGWNVKGVLSSIEKTTSSYFISSKHDISSKTLSNRLGSAVIQNGNEQEYKTYIDHLFSTNVPALFICKKLYRWFVNYDITDEVQKTVIEPLAQLLVESDYEIKPVLKALLSSEHFYEVKMVGTIIKNPLEFLFSLTNSTNSRFNFSTEISYSFLKEIYNFSAVIGMNYFRPPSVGGWTAYYQAPSFTRLWMNSSYVKLRFDVAAYLLTDGFKSKVDSNTIFTINVIDYVQGLSNPKSAPQIVDDTVLVFCPKGLTDQVKNTLKLILTDGQPDFEWTLQYDEYIKDSSNVMKKNAIIGRLRQFLSYLFKLPEFQTI
jgi:uncharacterized protein (DUF1800 family)